MGLAEKTPRTAPVAELYQTDYARWLFENARLLREGRFDELDIENVAEELEDMGRSEGRAVGSHLSVLLQHLLKWQYQQARRSKSWRLSIDNSRDAIEQLLRESPSIKPKLQDLLPLSYRIARRNAITETGLPPKTFPNDCPYPMDRILDHGFWPEAAEGAP